jgi:hypothetical protein
MWEFKQFKYIEPGTTKRFVFAKGTDKNTRGSWPCISWIDTRIERIPVLRFVMHLVKKSENPEEKFPKKIPEKIPENFSARISG